MKKVIRIEGMSCEHCESRVTKELMKVCGVEGAVVSATEDIAVVTLKHNVEDLTLTKAVLEAGYNVIGIE